MASAWGSDVWGANVWGANVWEAGAAPTSSPGVSASRITSVSDGTSVGDEEVSEAFTP